MQATTDHSSRIPAWGLSTTSVRRNNESALALSLKTEYSQYRNRGSERAGLEGGDCFMPNSLRRNQASTKEWVIECCHLYWVSSGPCKGYFYAEGLWLPKSASNSYQSSFNYRQKNYQPFLATDLKVHSPISSKSAQGHVLISTCLTLRLSLRQFKPRVGSIIYQAS